MVLKFKFKLNSRFILKTTKTIKIIKKSKNRRGLTQVKAIFLKVVIRRLSSKYLAYSIKSQVACFRIQASVMKRFNTKTIGVMLIEYRIL